MIRITNLRNGLHKEINANNISFKDYLKMLEFYSTLKNYQIKYYKI